MFRKAAIFGTWGTLGTCVGLVAAMTALGACKKSAGGIESDQDSDNQAFQKSFDDSEPPAAERKPVSGADLTALNEGAKTRFEALVDKLPSPCGKAHSLRTSRNSDAECLRAPFAVRYVVQMIDDGLTDKEVNKWYGKVYGASKPVRSFELSDAVPHTGPSDAPVTLVEFYDYGCPACKAFAPELDAIAKAFPTDVAIYYKQFPLSGHPDSPFAAQAVLAANAQGKFHEMHELLFQNAPQHKLPSLNAYAAKIELDMDKFAADYEAAAPQVVADKNEGIAAEVGVTPTLFIDGAPYEGPTIAEYLKIFVGEAIAQKR